MAQLKSGTTIAGNIVWHAGNTHASTHASGGSDPITPAQIGAVNKSGDTMTGELGLGFSRTKISGFDGANSHWFKYSKDESDMILLIVRKGANDYDLVLRNAGSDQLLWHAGISGPFYKGAGSPEGIVTAPVGAIYQRTDGGAWTTLYVKESGTGNTGWVAK